MTVAFTPGSCSLSGFRLTNAGFEWALDTAKTHTPTDVSPYYY